MFKIVQKAWRCISCCQSFCVKGGIDECWSKALRPLPGKSKVWPLTILSIWSSNETVEYATKISFLRLCILIVLSILSLKKKTVYWLFPDQWQMRDFERNGLNLTSTKREEMQRLRTQIDNLSFQYIQNLNDDNSFLLFSEPELAGLPLEFLKVQ